MDMQAIDLLTRSGIVPAPGRSQVKSNLRPKAIMQTPSDTPQFPGSKRGENIEKVRTFIKQQKRSKGYAFDVVNGSDNERQIQLSGMAKMFLGFSLLLSDTDPANFPTQFTFTINNEIIIEAVAPVFYSPDFMDDEYYFFPRPLNGSDNITVNFTGQASVTVYGCFYYL